MSSVGVKTAIYGEDANWGRIVAAAQEERFTRRKHDASFPRRAIEYCLEASGGSLAEVEHVVFYDKPFLKFERLLETYLAFAPRGFASFSTAVPLWLREKLFQKFLLKKAIEAVEGEIFDAIGGYPAEGTGYDLIFEQQLAASFPGAVAPFAVTPEEIAVSILAEPPVAVVDKVAEKHGTTAVVKAYLEHLYSPAGQEIAAKNFYRPRDKDVAAKYAQQFPKLELVTIDKDFGGCRCQAMAITADARNTDPACALSVAAKRKR